MNLAPVILLIAEGLAASPDVAKGVFEDIDAKCARVTELSQQREPNRIYADFGDPYKQNPSEDWRVVADTATLNRLAETSYPYTQALVWSDQGATLVQMFFASMSGDWALYEDHCFDNNGALIRNIGTLNTFNAIDPDSDASAGVSRVKTTYYDGNGKVLRAETQVLDLKTKEPKPRRQFLDQEDTVFLTMSAFPFSKLITH